jgi:hypothetical protein
MKRVMKKRFVLEYYKQELYIRLQTLRQGSLSVEEYVKEFELLLIRCELIFLLLIHTSTYQKKRCELMEP